MNNRTYLAYGKAFLAMAFWAMTFVWIKIALLCYTPVQIVFLRLILASVLLFLYSILTNHQELPSRKDIPQFLLVSFFEPFLYFMGEANGMQYVSPTLGSLIISTIPLVTVLGARLFLKEKLTLWLMAGLALSFAGVAVLVSETTEIWATAKGIALMLLAVVAGMFYGITVRSLTLKYRTVTIVSWQCVLGLMYFLPVFLLFESRDFFAMQHSETGLVTIAAMSLFGSVGAFLLFTGVIRELGVIRSNLTTNLIPVMTAIAAFIVLGDKPTFRAAAGILLVIFGLVISQLKDIRKVVIPAE